MTPLIRRFARSTENAEEFVWFDIGAVQRFEFRWSDLPGSRLPFDSIAICGTDKNGDGYAVFATHDYDNVIVLKYYSAKPTGYTESPFFALLMDEKRGGCAIQALDGEEPISKDMAAPIVGIMAEFLRRLEPKGCRPSPKKNHINKARAKKGKPLSYDWHTVDVTYTPAKREHKGGTHASPRRHQRRGHWRNRGGARVWVRDCWVGDASKGTVFKDYEVRA